MGDIDLSLPKLRKTPNRENIKILERPFLVDGKPQLNARTMNSVTNYFEVCEVVFEIEIERMKSRYKEHEVFMEVIDHVSSLIHEFLRKEIEEK